MGARGCPASLLLLSLLLLPLGLPVLGAPPRLICDSRVLERYILEAREAENVTMGCAEGCSFSENITVPDTKVNFYAWKRMEVEQQALEVWQGLALLSEAILRGQALLANSSQTSETLQLHVDKAISGLRSLTSLLRALGSQKEAISLPDATASAIPLRTFTVDTLCKFFRIYSNFLRGKMKLYTGEACRRGTGDQMLPPWAHPPPCSPLLPMPRLPHHHSRPPSRGCQLSTSLSQGHSRTSGDILGARGTVQSSTQI